MYGSNRRTHHHRPDGTALRLQGNGAWGPIAGFPTIPLPLMQMWFFDERHGWIVGFGVILYTEDGGETWRFCTGQAELRTPERKLR